MVVAGKASWPQDLKYHSGFGNHVESEALPNALPKGQNNPQKCPYGLYAEQLSGTAFTAPRHSNKRSWFYRTRPSCLANQFTPAGEKGSSQSSNKRLVSSFGDQVINPNQMRWAPLEIPDTDKDGEVDFVSGLVTFCGAGSPEMKSGLAVHLYACNSDMVDKSLCNSDGDFLIVPQQGALLVRTEMGLMEVAPGWICVVPRGIHFAVQVEGPSRGYVCEVFEGHFEIPDLGPIGANGLANPRDFQSPSACFEDRECEWTVVQKFCGKLFTAPLPASPFNAVAWHGNYAPFRYNLANFCVVNAVKFDHMDPSIFTVLTVQTNTPGVAACDLAIFPPRYMVQKDTFRPPYYHKNCMSEYMGNIRGAYEAKEGGFLPGGGSLHSIMIGHGPDGECFEKASNFDCEQIQFSPESNLAFMFETSYMMRLTEFAHTSNLVARDYHRCWDGVKKFFNPEKPESGDL